MSNKFFSLCFAVAMLSNVGYVLSKKESKDLWWDAEVEMEDQRLMKLEEEALRREEKKEKSRLKKMHAKEQNEAKKAKKEAAHAEKMKKKQEKEAQKKLLKEEKKRKKELSKKSKPKKAPHLKKKKKEKKKKEKKHSEHKSHPHKKKSKPKKKKRCGTYVSFAMEEKKARMREECAQREDLMANWAEMHEQAVKQDYENGRYADLYKLPAWPKWAHYFHQDNYVGVSAYYTHADDAYNSCGVNQDVSVLQFGHEPVRLRDILLVSHLVSCEWAEHADLLAADPFPGSNKNLLQQRPGRYFEYLANSVVDFKSRVESYGMDLNFSHYIYGRSVAIGVYVPVLYKKHRVRAHMNIEPTTVRTDVFEEDGVIQSETPEGIRKIMTDLERHPALDSVNGQIVDGDIKLLDFVPNAFLRRYGNDTQLLIEDILREKCFDQMGGSAMGLGDISLYINAQITSLLFDRIILGFRAKLPTGKEESPTRVWGAGLGTGLTELSVYSSIQLSHSRMCNPHAFIEASFGLLGHVERRVPRRYTLTDTQADNRRGETNPDDRYLSKEFPDLSFADRVYARATKGFCQFDSKVAALSDHTTTVRMAKGFQVDLMLGNVIEEFISRRGFLDVYYKLKAKWKDRISQPDLQTWNAELLWENSQSIAHTLGWEYSYQHDLDTRCRVGMHYILAGKNAPKEFGIDWSIDHSF